MKSEPDAYSIENLEKDITTLWDGIRNYQARNFMRRMELKDKVFFYHSNCKPPGIVGLMEVIEKNLVDPTQFDKNSKYYDPKSRESSPKWDCVKVKFLSKSQKSINLLSSPFIVNYYFLINSKYGFQIKKRLANRYFSSRLLY